MSEKDNTVRDAYTEEIIEKARECGELDFDYKQTAAILELPLDFILAELQNTDSPINTAYFAGKYSAKFEREKALLKKSKSGDAHASAELSRLQKERKSESLKEKMFYIQSEDYNFDVLRFRLDRVHPDIVKHYLENGESAALNKNQKEYLDQINHTLIHYTEKLLSKTINITSVAEALITKFGISRPTAFQRVYDAIGAFNLQSREISNHAWTKYFAAWHQRLAMYNVATDDMKEARRNAQIAHRLHTSIPELPFSEEELKPLQYIINPNVPKEQLNIKSGLSLKEIAAKSKEIIEVLPIDKQRKEALEKEIAQVHKEFNDTAKTTD